ncbi:MAG: hypothetical protein DRQ51_09270 [Gammaproteobacteria bacterium]|nr:MAG: hypothetical protein DRQ51_09270 [Gammaproteobacteria bacterium]
MFSYIFKKIINKITIFFWQKHQVGGGLYLRRKRNNKIKKILFYLDDSDYMHLGDHLFFEPLIRELNNYFMIEVTPTSQMRDYFEFNKININTTPDFADFDLIITKVEFLNFFKKSKQQILFIDTTFNEINQPLCLSLINRVSGFLNINNTKDKTGKPSNFAIKNHKIDCLLNKNTNYIIFNNYVLSGWFRTDRWQKNKLISVVKKLKTDYGHKIIHIGTKTDKYNDTKKYDFVDIDLRGKTNISDMFYLFSKKNIIYNVSFDTFQMMVAFMSNKKSWVASRHRIINNNTIFIKKHVHLFFKSNNVSLINYV